MKKFHAPYIGADLLFCFTEWEKIYRY